MKVFAFLLLILGCNLVNGGKLLAVQKFGAGYPSYHLIELNGDGEHFFVKFNLINLAADL